MTYGNMANVYYSKGEFDRALEFHEKALAIQKKMLGEEHPEVATC